MEDDEMVSNLLRKKINIANIDRQKETIKQYVACVNNINNLDTQISRCHDCLINKKVKKRYID